MVILGNKGKEGIYKRLKNIKNRLHKKEKKEKRVEKEFLKKFLIEKNMYKGKQKRKIERAKI